MTNAFRYTIYPIGSLVFLLAVCGEFNTVNALQSDDDEPLVQLKKKQFNQLLTRIWFGDDQMQDWVDLSDSQIREFENLKKKWYEDNLQIAMQSNKARQDRSNQLISNEEYQAIRKKLDEARNASTASMRRQTEELLVPSQIGILKEISKLRRLARESGTGDRFGIAIVLAKSNGSSSEEIKKIELAVKKARTAYYNSLKKEREISYKKILRSMSVEFRRKFKSKYPVFYDYESELVQGVDFD